MFDLSVIRAAQCLNPLKWKLLEKILRCTEVRTWTCLIFRQFRTLSTREAYREEEPSASDQALLEDGFRWFQGRWKSLGLAVQQQNCEILRIRIYTESI